MINAMFALVLACTFQASAQRADPPSATVWTSGSVSSARALFAPGTNVKVLGREDEEARERKSGFLPPAERDAVFRKIGIETKISSMDEFDRDMLMLSAREYTVRELRADYPMLSENELSRLKSELRRRK